MSHDFGGMFTPKPGLAYLDTATYGLPPRPTLEALDRAHSMWREGTAYWITDFDQPADRARVAFAELVGAAAENVALIPAASVGVGTVAAGLAPGAEVVIPDDEFTSVTFPMLVAEERGSVVRQVPFDRVAREIRPSTTLVAVSLVQAQTGKVADVELILDRAEKVGARVLVDGTHGLPFVRLHHLMDRIDYVVCAAYKHLLCPRGVGFLIVNGDVETLPPWNANWRAADEPYGRFYGGPLTLPATAARFDVSPAWLAWVGAAESLRLLNEWAATGSLADSLEVAAELAILAGVPWEGASLVCISVTDTAAAAAALAAADIKCGVRSDSIRFSTHVYNDIEDATRAAEVIAPFQQ